MIEPGDVLLYIARHGEVDEDKEGRMRGLENQELNENGHTQAKSLAWYFERHPLSAIFCDDLDRTYQTGLPTAESQQLEIGRDPELRSWDVGTELEGKSIAAHADEIAELKSIKSKVPVGGQSWGDYEQQVERAFNRYAAMAMGMPHPILLIEHGSFISIVAAMLGAAEMQKEYTHTFLEPGGIAAIYLTRGDGLVMRAVKGAKPAADE